MIDMFSCTPKYSMYSLGEIHTISINLFKSTIFYILPGFVILKLNFIYRHLFGTRCGCCSALAKVPSFLFFLAAVANQGAIKHKFAEVKQEQCNSVSYELIALIVDFSDLTD